MQYTGRTISTGLSRGAAHVIDAKAILSAAQFVPAEGAPDHEVARLHAAIGRACVELDRLQRSLHGRVPAGDVAIFESHAALMRDSKFVSRIEKQIRDKNLSADAAVSRVVNDLYGDFVSHQVTLLQDKAADILDIGRRLVHCLAESPRSELEVGAAAVIVAAAVTPSEIIRFAHQGVAAIVTENCGAKSHTAILARGLGIPLVTGIPNIVELVPPQSEIIVDAGTGRVFVSPTEAERVAIDSLFRQRETPGLSPEAPPHVPVTSDGVTIKLLLNISDPVEAEPVPFLGASGIGLFRTEFLYMDRPWWPSPETSYHIYRQVADAIGDAELNIRLVDFGAEKCPAYADIPVSRNPSLGLRGIRLLLQNQEIVRDQVEALSRLARERPITVLLPMIDTLDTLDASINLLCDCCGVTSRRDLTFKLGTMIEVPSAALMVEELLERVDSLAIGLNDLTQYLLAADRDDETVEKYHDAMQPSVLRLIHRIVVAARTAGKPVSVCGELAGDARLTGLFLALGLRRLSVSRSSYNAVVNAVRHLSVRAMDGRSDELLKLSTSAAVRKYVMQHFVDPAERKEEGESN
jgi:phosphoenolpyruvate-protein phosphotransferase